VTARLNIFCGLFIATIGTGACGKEVGRPALLQVFVGSHNEAAIAHLSFDPASGSLRTHDKIPAGAFPRALAWNAAARMLYAGNDRAGRITAFSVSASGRVEAAAEVASSSPGVWPVSLAVHPRGRWLLVGHYENGEQGPLSVVGLDDAGRPSGPLVISGDRCDDQGTFRVTFDPTGRYAFAVCDDDGLYGYRFDETSGALTRLDYPNELDHANGVGLLLGSDPGTAYLHADFDMNVSVLSYDASSATFTLPPREVVSFAVPGEPLPFPRPIFMPLPRLIPAVTIGPGGRHLFGVNFQQNAVVVLTLARDGGVASKKVMVGTGSDLRRPVHAVATADERWLFVANEETGTVAVFSIDESAELALVGAPVPAVSGASSIALVE
jgi:6-phosphogluconolactonase (cycloisomerase 2 family)